MLTSTKFPSTAYSSTTPSPSQRLTNRALLAKDIDQAGNPVARIVALQAYADDPLAQADEMTVPETQAWRRACPTMGLRPTQYPCPAEALLHCRRKAEAHALIAKQGLHQTARADLVALPAEHAGATAATWRGSVIGTAVTGMTL